MSRKVCLLSFGVERGPRRGRPLIAIMGSRPRPPPFEGGEGGDDIWASCISHRSCHVCSRAGERLARRRAATAGPSRRRLCSNCRVPTVARSCAKAVPVRPQPRRWPRRTDGGAHRAYATETLRVAAGGVARPRPSPGRRRGLMAHGASRAGTRVAGTRGPHIRYRSKKPTR
jgi:hypothetical protein